MTRTANTRPPTSKITSAQARHSAEVSALILSHLPGLRASARCLVSSRDQADDLVQDTIVRALAAAEQFTLGTNFRGWVHTILRNQRYNLFRRPWAQHTPLQDLQREPSQRATQDLNLEICDFRRAFRQLHANQRRALILVGVDGLSYDDTAQQVKCATGTIKSRVSRGRRDLKALLTNSKLALSRRDVAPISGIDFFAAISGPVRSSSRRTDGYAAA